MKDKLINVCKDVGKLFVWGFAMSFGWCLANVTFWEIYSLF